MVACIWEYSHPFTSRGSASMGLTMDENRVSVEHVQTFPILIPSAIQSHRFLHTICIAFGMISNLEIKVCRRLCTAMLSTQGFEHPQPAAPSSCRQQGMSICCTLLDCVLPGGWIHRMCELCCSKDVLSKAHNRKSHLMALSVTVYLLVF